MTTPPPTAEPVAWELWRRDDWGNEFRMARYATREEAEHAEREYTARGHKQDYWVQPVLPPG